MPLPLLHIIILGTFALNASACLPGADTLKKQEIQKRSPSRTPLVENDGVVTMTINPDATSAQYIQAASGTGIESAQVVIPPGAINIAMNISLEEASSIATPATVGHLELNNSFLNAGKAIGVTANVNLDATKPFILSLPVPTTKLRLADDPLDTLSVVFKVKIAATGEIRTGIIPRKELIIENNVIKIETTYFGVYQAVLTEKLLAEKVETKIDSNLQMKREEKTLPPMEVLGRQPVVVKRGETITLTGKNFRPTMTLAWNGSSINKLKYMSDSQVSFTAPSEGSLGLLALNVLQEGSSSSVSLVFQGDGSTLVGSFSPSEVCSDVTYFDLNGKSQQGTRNCSGTVAPACSADGEVGCVTNASYKAAKMENVSAANIRKGVTVSGVSGDYPSATYPLSGSSQLTDLSTLTANAVNGSYEWFQSDGTRMTGSIDEVGSITPTANAQVFNTNVVRAFTVLGDPDLKPENIRYGINIFGITGSFGGPCNTEGQQECLVTQAYKATNPANYSPWDIRKGVTIGGHAGEIFFPKNMANLTRFNRTSGSGSTASLDFYDTIDDYNNDDAFPPNAISGWPSVGTNWYFQNDSNSNGICDEAEACIFMDKITKLMWINEYPTAQPTWEQAISQCENSTYGGFADWRLPTQKEILQAYINGIVSLKDAQKLNFPNWGEIWSSTTSSEFTTDAITVYIKTADLENRDKASMGFPALCVR